VAAGVIVTPPYPTTPVQLDGPKGAEQGSFCVSDLSQNRNPCLAFQLLFLLILAIFDFKFSTLTS
jgi:hypothetical protein